MSDELFNLFNNNPNLVSFCPVCNQKFHSLQATVISEKKNGYLMHVYCRKCQASLLTLISADNSGINSVGLITDLAPNEVKKFYGNLPICDDDILSIHQLLAQKKVLIDKL